MTFGELIRLDIISVLQIAALSMLLGYMLTVLPGVSKGPGNAYDRSRKSRRNADEGERPGALLLILVLVGSLTFARDVIVGSTPFGSTRIGGTFEKGEYTEEYYVLAFPEGSRDLNYKVKAEIQASIRYEGFELVRVYRIMKIAWPQGGTTTFEKEGARGYSLEPEKLVAVSDDDGKVWEIQLTEEKAD